MFGIDAHLIFAHGAAEVGNVHDVGNGLELLLKNPVFQRPQFHQVDTADLCFSACTNRSGRWCSSPCRFEAGGPCGRVDLREPFQDLLPVPVVHRAVVEDHDHERQAENRLGAQICQVRHSGHLHFDRNRDLLFHLFGGTARPLGDDRRVVVARYRDRLPPAGCETRWRPSRAARAAIASTTNLLFSAKSTRARIILSISCLA